MYLRKPHCRAEKERRKECSLTAAQKKKGAYSVAGWIYIERYR
jgi:hypothetical protein